MALNQTGSPNLKPFRSYTEHEVINGLYSSSVVPLNKGTFVTIIQASGNPNVNLTGTGLAAVSPFIGYANAVPGTPEYATSLQFGIVSNKVRAANSGEVVLGVSLVDCAETNKYGEAFAYRPVWERHEQQVVVSGEALKILTRGLITTNGFSGTPSANTGAYVHAGVLVPCPYNKTTQPQLVGKFLEGADADGYALFKVEL